jgi:hypothetical protein
MPGQNSGSLPVAGAPLAPVNNGSPARVQVPRQRLGWSSEIQGACNSTMRRVA